MKKQYTLTFFFCCISIAASFGQAWSAMGPAGLGSGAETVQAIAINPVTSEIYAGGTFTTPVSYLAKWNSTSQIWEQVGSGVSGPVYALGFKNSELYIGGLFSTAGGVSVHNIAKLSGSTFSDVGGGFNDQVKCIYVSAASGNIYAGGAFSQSGTSTMNHISQLVGTTWTQLGTGIGAVVNSIVDYGTPTAIYAGCENQQAPVQKFNTVSWSNVAGSDSIRGGKVYALASFGGFLYAGGDFSTPIRAGAKWDGTNWNTISTNFNVGQKVSAFYLRSTILYIGGNFTGVGVGSPSYIAKITNTNSPIQSFTISSALTGGEVFAICNDHGKVIAGGKFVAPTSPSTNNISITTVGISVDEIDGIVTAKNFFPNPVEDVAHLTISTINKLKNPEISIFDLQSQLIFNLPVSMSSNNNEVEFTFDCANLSKGIYYYLVTENGNGIASDKFVVE